MKLRREVGKKDEEPTRPAISWMIEKAAIRVANAQATEPEPNGLGLVRERPKPVGARG